MQNLATEELHKEIDLIQSCINRMASNSFMVKGWMITLVAALVALLSDKVSVYTIGVLSSVIILCFWYVDGFFLKTEKLYRRKYEWVIKKRIEGNTQFLYDLNPYNNKMWEIPNQPLPSVLGMMLSKTLMPFYGLPLIIAIGAIVLKLFGQFQ